jgi:hypothetical protein
MARREGRFCGAYAPAAEERPPGPTPQPDKNFSRGDESRVQGAMKWTKLRCNYRLAFLFPNVSRAPQAELLAVNVSRLHSAVLTIPMTEPGSQVFGSRDLPGIMLFLPYEGDGA